MFLGLPAPALFGIFVGIIVLVIVLAIVSWYVKTMNKLSETAGLFGKGPFCRSPWT